MLAVAAPAAAVLAVAKPGVGASAAEAGASGATTLDVAAPSTGASAAAALGTNGLAEVAAPELPTSAVPAEAPVTWTQADEPAAAEELPGREALPNEEKKLFSKKRSTRNKGSEQKNTYPEAPGLQRPRRLGDRCCRGSGGGALRGCCCCCPCGGGGGGGCCCCCCCRGEAPPGGGGGDAATPGVPRELGARELPWPASSAAL